MSISKPPRDFGMPINLSGGAWLNLRKLSQLFSKLQKDALSERPESAETIESTQISNEDRRAARRSRSMHIDIDSSKESEALELSPESGQDSLSEQLVSTDRNQDFKGYDQDPRPAKRHKSVRSGIESDVNNSNSEPIMQLGLSPPMKSTSLKEDGGHPEKQLESDSKLDREGSDPAKLGTTRRVAEQLPLELQHLVEKYNFFTMSIGASSKIEQKVRNLLKRSRPVTANDSSAKPGVVILTAKSDTAQKMVSIVEIAKRAITNDGGQTWQYNKLQAQATELKKKPRYTEAGKTILESKKQSNQEEDDVVAEGADEKQGIEDEREDEEAFQTMGRRQVMALDPNRPKIRAIPVMNIYFSQFPVPELRKHCKYVVIPCFTTAGTDRCPANRLLASSSS